MFFHFEKKICQNKTLLYLLSFLKKELEGKVWVLWTHDQQFLENQWTGFHSTVDLKKPKELVKGPSPQSFGSFTSSSINQLGSLKIFKNPKQEFILEIFQKP
jgi:hypothetical protein